ncbi:MAG: DinB family protein [Fimbriimonadaceae bacterium]
MRVQDFIADETMRATEGLIHQTTRMPDGKSDWKPLDEGRTALDQVAECALICGAMVKVLEEFRMPDFTPEMMEEFERKKSALSLESAIDLLRQNSAVLGEAIRAVPDEKLAEEMSFWGPEKWTVAAVMNYHNWNLVYHTGQVSYIQTLYGDKGMG